MRVNGNDFTYLVPVEAYCLLVEKNCVLVEISFNAFVDLIVL